MGTTDNDPNLIVAAVPTRRLWARECWGIAQRPTIFGLCGGLSPHVPARDDKGFPRAGSIGPARCTSSRSTRSSPRRISRARWSSSTRGVLLLHESPLSIGHLHIQIRPSSASGSAICNRVPGGGMCGAILKNGPSDRYRNRGHPPKVPFLRAGMGETALEAPVNNSRIAVCISAWLAPSLIST